MDSLLRCKGKSSITRSSQRSIINYYYINYYCIVSGVNYQLLAVILPKLPNGILFCCNRPQPATDNGIRDGRSNWLDVAAPPFTRQCPLGATCTVQIFATSTENQTCYLPHMRQALAYATTRGIVLIKL